MDQSLVSERTALLSSPLRSAYESSQSSSGHVTVSVSIDKDADRSQLAALYDFLHSHSQSLDAFETPWFASPQDVARAFDVDLSIGLSAHQADQRRAIIGINAIPTYQQSIFQTVKEEITEPLILMLLSVAVLYFLWGSISQSITIALLVCLCISIEIGVEHRANQAINELSSNKVPSTVTTLRQSINQSIDPSQLVPGDIIELNAGDAVPADIRLIDSLFVLVDESSLTGESDWVEKCVPESSNPAARQFDHKCMLWSGTFLTQGCARGIVVNTGSSSVAGSISQSINQSKKRRKTPLQQALKRLAYQLTIVTIVIVIVCFVVCFITFTSDGNSIIQPLDLIDVQPNQESPSSTGRWSWPSLKQAFQQSVLVCLSLAFAVIPEELPILIKVIAGYQSIVLSTNQLIVRSMRSIEGLASVNVLLSDKTGTITMNRLRVDRCLVFERLEHTSSDKTLKANNVEQQVNNRPVNRTTNESADLHSPSNQSVLIAWARSSPTLRGQILPVKQLTKQSTDHSFVPSIDCSAVNDRFDPAVLKALSICPSKHQSSTQRTSQAISEPHHQVNNLVHPSLYQFTREHFNLLTEPINVETFLPFDTRRRSSTIVCATQTSGQRLIYTRGSIDSVLAVCSHSRDGTGQVYVIDDTVKQRWLSECSLIARSHNGVRILAFASKSLHPSSSASQHVSQQRSSSFMKSSQVSVNQSLDEIECDMVFEGLIGFTDELRHGVSESIKQLKRAGITVKMVTGDSVDTATAIARSIGLVGEPISLPVVQITDRKPLSFDESNHVIITAASKPSNNLSLHDIDSALVFCRQSPLDKLNLVRAHQAMNYCVLATGDGLNDAPSLACAEVGLAMGNNYVAKQAAGIVLLEHSLDQPSAHSFDSIVLLIREGRRMMSNLITAIQFYLSCKAALICLFLVSLVVFGYVPMLPVHVILLECFMDLGASVAFTTEKCNIDIMNRQPSHWTTSRLIGGHTFWLPIALSAFVLYAAVGGVLALGHSLTHYSQSSHQTVDQATEHNIVQTMTFVSWMVGHVLLAHAVRTFDRSMLFDAVIDRFKRRHTITQPCDASIFMSFASNTMLLVWTCASFVCVILCLSLDPLRELLQLQSLSQRVDVVLNESSDILVSVPVIAIAVIWPFTLFLFGELVKLVYSLYRRQ